MNYSKAFFLVFLSFSILTINAQIVRNTLGAGADITIGAVDTAVDIAERPVEWISDGDDRYYRNERAYHGQEYREIDPQAERRLRQHDTMWRNQ